MAPDRNPDRNHSSGDLGGIYNLLLKSYLSIMLINLKPLTLTGDVPAGESDMSSARRCKCLLEIVKVFTKGPYAAALKMAIEAPATATGTGTDKNKSQYGKSVVGSTTDRSVCNALVKCVLSHYRMLIYDEQVGVQSEHCCSLLLSSLLKCSKYVVQYFNCLFYTDRNVSNSLCVLQSDYDSYTELSDYLSTLFQVMHSQSQSQSMDKGAFLLSSIPTRHHHIYSEALLQCIQSSRGLMEGKGARGRAGAGATEQCVVGVVALHETVCLVSVPLLLTQAGAAGVGLVEVLVNEIVGQLQLVVSGRVEANSGQRNNMRVEALLGLLERLYATGIYLQAENGVAGFVALVSAALRNAWDIVLAYSERQYAFRDTSQPKRCVETANQLKSTLFCSLVRCILNVDWDREYVNVSQPLHTQDCSYDHKLRIVLGALQRDREGSGVACEHASEPTVLQVSQYYR